MDYNTKDRLSIDGYIKGILGQDRIILSKAITIIESSLRSDTEIAEKILEGIMSATGNSIRVGVTGVPGVGKSTFIEKLGEVITHEELQLAVLAIDPSSKKSGGSIMGDKTRMEKLSSNINAFIRPSPTGQSIGGVADKTRETILLCEAAGFNVILVETVGVGQSELAVREMVDFFLLLMLSRSGDELQGMKRGIIEMADAIVITKADEDNINAANQARSQFNSALHLFPLPESQWRPRVLTCSSREGTGIKEIWEMILEYKELMIANNYWNEQRVQQKLDWFRSSIQTRLLSDFRNTPGIQELIDTLENQIREEDIAPTRAAATVVSQYKKHHD